MMPGLSTRIFLIANIKYYQKVNMKHEKGDREEQQNLQAIKKNSDLTNEAMFSRNTSSLTWFSALRCTDCRLHQSGALDPSFQVWPPCG